VPAPGHDIVHICGNKAELKALAKALSDLAEQSGKRVLQTEPTAAASSTRQASYHPPVSSKSSAYM
jgi:hypothetical protein